MTALTALAERAGRPGRGNRIQANTDSIAEIWELLQDYGAELDSIRYQMDRACDAAGIGTRPALHVVEGGAEPGARRHPRPALSVVRGAR